MFHLFLVTAAPPRPAPRPKSQIIENEGEYNNGFEFDKGAAEAPQPYIIDRIFERERKYNEGAQHQHQQ